eukprot:GDKJ01024188.1.p1 GENE.GDKJ01024188.1~~GDKJ01024188.1.p1  ORF type:complete len:187 (-),score=54.30 GDKJ01024188.1:181-741(-)
MGNCTMDSATVQHVCSLINKRDYLAFESILASESVKELKTTDPDLFKLLETLKSGSVADLEALDKSVFTRYGLVFDAVLAKLRVIQFVSHANVVAISQKSGSFDISLEEVAKISGCSSTVDAEDVVVLSVVLGLVKASIDEDSSSVKISSVTPVRDLDSLALWKTLQQRVDSWLDNIKALKAVLQA